MATATDTIAAPPTEPKGVVRLGPASHGWAMTLDQFEATDLGEGWLFELARGIVIAIDVPELRHGRIVGRLARTFIHYEDAHPGTINYRAGRATCHIPIPGIQSDRRPDLAVYFDRAAEMPEPLAPLVPRPRRRGRQPRQRRSRLRREARGIPPRRRPRILGARPGPSPAARAATGRGHLGRAGRRRRRHVPLRFAPRPRTPARRRDRTGGTGSGVNASSEHRLDWPIHRALGSPDGSHRVRPERPFPPGRPGDEPWPPSADNRVDNGRPD